MQFHRRSPHSIFTTNAFSHPATFCKGSIADLKRELVLDALKPAKAKGRRENRSRAKHSGLIFEPFTFANSMPWPTPVMGAS